METLQVKFLDHVAIKVKDIEISCQWYKNVLGLKQMDIPKWGNCPVFMSCGKTGVAIFPANLNDPAIDNQSKNIEICHFAFNVSNAEFEKAKSHYKRLLLEFDYQDHYYFHSIYTKDPDGHTVELTTLVVEENVFYR